MSRRGGNDGRKDQPVKLRDMTATLDRMRTNSRGFWESLKLESYREEAEASEQMLEILYALQMIGTESTEDVLSALRGYSKLAEDRDTMKKQLQEYSQVIGRLKKENDILCSIIKAYGIMIRAAGDSSFAKARLSAEDKSALVKTLLPGLDGLRELFVEMTETGGIPSEH